MGLLVGVELKEEYGKAKPYGLALMQEGILCKETHEQTLRLAAPLVISQDDLDWAIPRLKKVLSTLPEELHRHYNLKQPKHPQA